MKKTHGVVFNLKVAMGDKIKDSKGKVLLNNDWKHLTKKSKQVEGRRNKREYYN